MSLVRITPLKDFLSTPVTETGNGTAYNLGGLTTGQYLYGALHLTQASTNRGLVVTIQSACTSAFAAPSTRFTFALSSDRGSTWGTRVGNLSTEHKWFRAVYTLSTAISTSTGGSWNGLVWVGRR